jgi:hypothetical protein
MTENLADLAIRPSYEEVRDKVPNSAVRELWCAGDADAARARTEMQKVHEDKTLSEEGRKQAAQRVIDRYAGQAQRHYAEAREKGTRSVENARAFSVPMPGGGTLATSRAKDSGELVAVQGEAERIVQKVAGEGLLAMTKEASKNPRDRGMRESASHRAAALREEYARAMSIGGLEGKVLAHATLRAAEAMGIDRDSVVDGFRNDRQRRYVQEADQLEAMCGSIPSGRNLARNPYDGNQRLGGKRSLGTYGSTNKSLVQGGRPQLFQKQRRKRLWK